MSPDLTWKPGPPPLDKNGVFMLSVADGRTLVARFDGGMYVRLGDDWHFAVQFLPDAAALVRYHLGPIPDPPAAREE